MPRVVHSLGWERHTALATSISLVLEMAVPDGAPEAWGSVLLSEKEVGQG